MCHTSTVQYSKVGSTVVSIHTPPPLPFDHIGSDSLFWQQKQPPLMMKYSDMKAPQSTFLPPTETPAASKQPVTPFEGDSKFIISSSQTHQHYCIPVAYLNTHLRSISHVYLSHLYTVLKHMSRMASDKGAA